MSQTIAFFGVGLMGRSCLGTLSRRLPDTKFRLFDISEENLARAQALVPDRSEVFVCNIKEDKPDLSGASVAINFAGPFYLGSDRLARFAIEAGVPYIDVCDDAEGTQTTLELDAAAKEKGVSILTGGGNSPGVSNWLACKLLAEDPEIDGIQIVWVTRESDPGGLAVLRHMLHMTVAPCPTWRNGRMEHTKGFVQETAETFKVPAPFHEIEAYDTAHPEPLTLAHAFPHLKLAQCKGSLYPNWANAAFSTLGRIGFGHSDITVEMNGQQIQPIEVLWKLLWERHNLSGNRQRDASVQINVIGLSGDTPRRMLSITDGTDMARGTGIGMACAALALLEGDVPSGANGVEALPYERGLEIWASLCADEGAFPDGIVETEFAE